MIMAASLMKARADHRQMKLDYFEWGAKHRQDAEYGTAMDAEQSRMTPPARSPPTPASKMLLAIANSRHATAAHCASLITENDGQKASQMRKICPALLKIPGTDAPPSSHLACRRSLTAPSSAHARPRE